MTEQEQALKAQALLERVSELTTGYENKVADLRVQVTLLAQQNEELRQWKQDREAQDAIQEVASSGTPADSDDDSSN